jgi:tetratricopeptide (TPR) repeat protein
MNLDHDMDDAHAHDAHDDYDPDGMRGRSPSLSDGPPSMGRRRSVGGFIVAAVVVGGVALIGAVWAKDHLGGVLGSRPAPVATADPRAAGLLATGEKALSDGNLEAAKESFDKASALAEKDPHVLLDVARLASMRADVPWLKSRLLPADAADDIRVTKDSLAELSAAARKAADDALAVAPDDPAVVRTKIDALRISGDRDGARALVAKVAGSASQPETAYVLAALDLAENEPLWSTVIERLRVASSAESGPGRARAALAYALARSGDVAGAKAEVERLAAMSHPPALLPLLRAFTDRAKPVAKADVGAASAIDAGAIATGPDAGRPVRDRAGDHGGEPGGGHVATEGRDGRQLVAQGEAARAKGDYDRAQTLFAAALDRNPNDAEALAGLAAIAHARRDLNGARASYKRVLSINPSYVPALVGVGDVDWESGDRASAMKTYKEIVDRFPEGTYPARVKQRVEAGAAPAPAPAPASTDPGGGG